MDDLHHHHDLHRGLVSDTRLDELDTILTQLQGCTETEFAALAMLAADQAGLDLEWQRRLRAEFDRTVETSR